jgi:hypothetical protein
VDGHTKDAQVGKSVRMGTRSNGCNVCMTGMLGKINLCLVIIFPGRGVIVSMTCTETLTAFKTSVRVRQRHTSEDRSTENIRSQPDSTDDEYELGIVHSDRLQEARDTLQEN